MIAPRSAVPSSPLADLEAAWRRSDALFDWLGPERLMEQPIGLRHPCIFYLGHLPAFAWNQLGRGVLGLPPIDERYDELFERGIDPEDEAAAADHAIESWPGIDDIRAYRDRVRDAVRTHSDKVQAVCSPLGPRILWLITEHERMHHETLLYMFQELEGRPWASRITPGPGVAPRRLRVGAGTVALGADFDTIPFGWDNEFPLHTTRVPAFDLDHLPVRNIDFLAFLEHGWSKDQWWREADVAWRADRPCPDTWRRSSAGWEIRAPGRWVPLDDAAGWPAQVSWAAAHAFCHWSGARLPTEAELHRAAFTAPDGTRRAYPWGDRSPDPSYGNFDFVHESPVPTGSHPRGASAWGIEELVGNGWEWTSSVFSPRPGFEAWHHTYPGYSADFFDGAHRVVFGASWATDRIFLRRSFRNWYQERYPYVFSSFRRAWTVA